MLHITSNDLATRQLRLAALPGTVLPWRDALHEGPVLGGVPLPVLSGIRARYLAANGWTDYQAALEEYSRRDHCLSGYFEHDEVVLWFAPALCEQLQMLQLLDWFSHQDLEETRLSLVDADASARTPGVLDPAGVTALFAARIDATPHQLALARRAWGALCSPNPRAIEDLLAQDTAALPHLRPALHRHLEQFPAADSGLCRTARQIIQAVDVGADEPAMLLETAEHREPARFLAEPVFWSYVAMLTLGPHPLIGTSDGCPFHTPEAADEIVDPPVQKLKLTRAGVAVLKQHEDAIRLNGIDRWRGGVHLDHRFPHWRWDLERQRLSLVEP